MIGHVDALHNQDVAVFLDLADGLSAKAFPISLNSTRLQRAAVRADQSAGGGGYQVVQSGRVRLMDLRIRSVVLSDFGVQAEEDRLLFRGQVGPAQGTLHRLDAYARAVDDRLSQECSSSP